MNTATNYRRFSKYLFLFGVALGVAGLVTGLLTGEWSTVPVILLVIGIALIVNYLIVLLGSNQDFWAKRSTQIGTNALVATFFMVVVLGLINFLAVRYQLRLDLTDNQLFTLSPQSQQVVKVLPKTLKVWVFERSPNPEDQALLKNYQRYGDNFEFEFIDPQVRLELAQKFGVTNFGEVYVEFGDKKQIVQTLSPDESLSEVALTNAIVKVQRDRTPKAYFLQGHGEPLLETVEGGMSQALSAMEDNGFVAEPLLLGQLPQIPADADVVIVAGPKRELLSGELQALQNYLQQGGSMLLMLDPNTEPGVDPLLEDWGVEVDDLVVIDASGIASVSGFGPLTPLVNTYGNHPITRDFANGYSFYPLARTIDSVEEEKDNIDAIPLLITGEESWAESQLNPEANETVDFDEGRDRRGPLNLGLALSRQLGEDKNQEKKEEPNSDNQQSEESDSETSKSENQEEVEKDNQESADQQKEEEKNTSKLEARLVVIGNSTFATNGWFDEQLNDDIFLNSVNWLSKDDDQSLSLRPKQQQNRRLNITPIQAAVLNWLNLLIMPLLALIAAVVVWWQRR